MLLRNLFKNCDYVIRKNLYYFTVKKNSTVPTTYGSRSRRTSTLKNKQTAERNGRPHTSRHTLNCTFGAKNGFSDDHIANHFDGKETELGVQSYVDMCNFKFHGIIFFPFGEVGP